MWVDRRAGETAYTRRLESAPTERNVIWITLRAVELFAGTSILTSMRNDPSCAGLSPDQRVRIDSIMDCQGRELCAIRTTVQPQVDSMITRTRRQLDSILAPDQRKKAEAIRRRMPHPPGPPPDGPGRPGDFPPGPPPEGPPPEP